MLTCLLGEICCPTVRGRLRAVGVATLRVALRAPGMVDRAIREAYSLHASVVPFRWLS